MSATSSSELAASILADPGFAELLSRINVNFETLMRMVVKYAGQYKQFAEMFVENKNLVDCGEVSGTDY